MAICCEHGNEPSVLIKCWEFIDQLRNCYLLKSTLVHKVRRSVGRSVDCLISYVGNRCSILLKKLRVVPLLKRVACEIWTERGRHLRFQPLADADMRGKKDKLERNVHNCVAELD